MIHLSHKKILLLTGIFFSLLCITTNAHSQEHLTIDQAKSFFPSQLKSYRFKSLKVKSKNQQWKEFSGTYLSGKNKLKLILNQVVPSGNPEWKKMILPAEETTAGFPSMIHKKGDKHTLMVLIKKMFRLDFKSRDIDPNTLRELAKEYDFSTFNQ